MPSAFIRGETEEIGGVCVPGSPLCITFEPRAAEKLKWKPEVAPACEEGSVAVGLFIREGPNSKLFGGGMFVWPFPDVGRSSGLDCADPGRDHAIPDMDPDLR
jgi:hypothetical protein